MKLHEAEANALARLGVVYSYLFEDEKTRMHFDFLVVTACEYSNSKKSRKEVIILQWQGTCSLRLEEYCCLPRFPELAVVMNFPAFAALLRAPLTLTS